MNPMLGRRERKKLEVEQRIRSAALELFREKGYDATSVEEIAERADVAKGTFFNYFPRKDALLSAQAEDVAAELMEELGPLDEWTGTAADQLLRLFLKVGDLVARDPELSKTMLIENMRRFWLCTEAEPLEREFNELVKLLVRRGVERGEFEAGTDVEQAAKLVEAAYFTTLVEWMRRGAPGTEYRRDIEVKFAIIFRGLGLPGAAT
ncbi:MAG TPA: TetR/AcrR family transcriptional regulator [Longimicrobiales bacterium]|nr:TetR/AcrR family transcriptional regulator [Longimicrobiales bacterium]